MIEHFDAQNKTSMLISDDRALIRPFLLYVKSIAKMQNQLELHKRHLCSLLNSHEPFQANKSNPLLFGLVDLNHEGKVTPKTLQQYLTKHRYFVQAESVNRFNQKYGKGCPYLIYETFYSAILPKGDYCTAAGILTYQTVQYPALLQSYNQKILINTKKLGKVNIQNHNSKKLCHIVTIELIDQTLAQILNQELIYLNREYSIITMITRNSQRIGSMLWRLMDRYHDNSLGLSTIEKHAQQCNISVTAHQWQCFMAYHFSPYKLTMKRDDFMKIVSSVNRLKRATKDCRAGQKQIQDLLAAQCAYEQRRKKQQEEIVRKKLQIIGSTGQQIVSRIIREEHLPYGLLKHIQPLKGKKGYSVPKNLIKTAIERTESIVL